MLDLLIIILLPFIQIGFSFYFSVQMMACVIILASSRLFKIVGNKWFFVGFGVAILMCLETALYFGARNVDVLGSARKGAILAVMLGMMRSSLVADERIKSIILPLVNVVATAMLVLIIIQAYFLSQKVYFGLPQSWFVINAATLPGELSLIYSRLRPTGTFGEPSYLSLVCVVIIISFMPLWKDRLGARIIIFISAAAVFLSMSMLGILVVLFALARIGLAIGARSTFIIFFPLLLFLIFFEGSISDSRVIERLQNIYSGQDFSFNVRILDPARILLHVLSSNPMGIPEKIFVELSVIPGVGVEARDLVHNAFFTILFNYGWLGIIIISLLVSAPRTFGMRIIVITMMFQNGSMMSFDKLAILYVAIMLESAIGARAKTVNYD